MSVKIAGLMTLKIDNVAGIDIHPVAVQLAKATWVMAAADTIRATRAEDTGTGTGAVSAPIYLN